MKKYSYYKYIMYDIVIDDSDKVNIINKFIENYL